LRGRRDCNTAAQATPQRRALRARPQRRLKPAASPSSASGGSGTAPSPKALRKPATVCSPSPGCRRANGVQRGLRMRSSGCTRVQTKDQDADRAAVRRPSLTPPTGAPSSLRLRFRPALRAIVHDGGTTTIRQGGACRAGGARHLPERLERLQRDTGVHHTLRLDMRLPVARALRQNIQRQASSSEEFRDECRPGVVPGN
jgi:hypothetical protein